MSIGRMLIASIAAGAAAPWSILLYFGIALLLKKPVDNQIYALPLSIAAIGCITGLAVYFPYSFIRKRKGWAWPQDLIVHSVAAVILTTTLVLKVAEQTGTAADLVVTAFVGSLAVICIALPAPIVFALLMRTPRQHSHES